MTGISIAPAALIIVSGVTMPLHATETVIPGQPVETTFVWRSDAPSVATVDSTGSVTSHQFGVATITAHDVRDSTVRGAADITVSVARAPCLASVLVTPAALTLAIGDTARVHVQAVCSLPPATRFTWRSSDSTVASIDGTGWVRGLREGSATLIATAAGAPQQQGAAAITVIPK